MKTKHCPRCDTNFPISNFHKDITTRDGLHSCCKNCVREDSKRYRKENSEKVKEIIKKWHEKNPNKRKEYFKKYIRKKAKYNKDSYCLRKEKILNHNKNRYNTDFNYKLKQICRSLIVQTLNRQSATKNSKTKELIGCSSEELRVHLESKFQKGMTWSNYGKGYEKWNIDHIKPCASFDLKDPEQQKQCFHYTNLQPMWSNENISKGSLYEGRKHFHIKNLT